MTASSMPVGQEPEEVPSDNEHIVVGLGASAGGIETLNDGHIEAAPVKGIEERRAPVDKSSRSTSTSHRKRTTIPAT